MKKPLVTVMVSTYNDGKYLRRCIDAILAQTYKAFEFVIVNDCDRGRSSWLAGEEKEGERQSQTSIQFHKVIINQASGCTIQTFGSM